MSDFDIALGLTNDPLNKIGAALFNNPAAKTKFFSSSLVKQVDGVGKVSLSFQALSAPEFTLEPPTAAQWDASIKGSGVTAIPTKGVFQLYFDQMTAEITVGDAPPINGTGEFTVIATVADDTASGTLSLTPQAIVIDESKLSMFDKWMIEKVIGPAGISMAAGYLSAIAIPGIPTYPGVSLETPQIEVQKGLLLAGTFLKGNSTEINFGGITWPDKKQFALISPALIESASAPEVAKLNITKSDSAQSGNDAAWGKGSYDLKTTDATVKVDRNNPLQVDLSIKIDLSVTGSFGGYGVAAACPVGAALNAM